MDISKKGRLFVAIVAELKIFFSKLKGKHLEK